MQSDADLPSLKETFSKIDKNPFGASIMYKSVAKLFHQNTIQLNKEKLEKSLSGNSDTGQLYINISKNFYLTKEDLNEALNFVHNGNSMFVASENFDTAFLKTMGLTKEINQNRFGSIMDMRNTAVHLSNEFFSDTNSFSYFYFPLDHYFGSTKDSVPNILGMGEYERPNFVILFYGRGRIYIHCEPRVFSNYFLLQQKNLNYLQQVLSFVPAKPTNIFWDNYYFKRNTAPTANGKKGLAVLLQYPAMAWAFWLVILLLAVYLLFGSKRRQRIIQPLPSNVNTTVAFTETISRLYLQQKDNRSMADKIILYFMEHIRNQYFLNTQQLNELFLTTLSRKSNRSIEDTTKLFKTINTIQQSDNINDQQLLSLNKQIENFYKQTT